MKHLAFMAGVIGNTQDQKYYLSLYNNLTQEFNVAFYNDQQKGYADNKQTANVLALALPEIVPPNLRNAVGKTLLNDLKQHGNHLTTGIIGTRFLFEVLHSLDQADLAVSMLMQTDYPSYGYMFNNPHETATTLWELWDAPNEGPGMNSRNHIMFGSVGAYFYRHLAGIRPNALTTIEIAPPSLKMECPLHTVNASYDSLKGMIRVFWERTKTGFHLQTEIPTNTQGLIRIPVVKGTHGYSTLMEKDTLLWEKGILASTLSEGILDVASDEDNGSFFSIRVMSGAYDFTATF
jgi:alpha-L-rhamnosidase